LTVPPKIYLDHSLKDRAIVVKAGNKVRVDVPISGEPAPVPDWKKGPKVLNFFLILKAYINLLTRLKNLIAFFSNITKRIFSCLYVV